MSLPRSLAAIERQGLPKAKASVAALTCKEEEEKMMIMRNYY